MVQILPPRDRGPSFGERINAGVGQGLGLLEQYQQQYQQKELMSHENAALKKMGVDLTGIHDPKIRQEYAKLAVEGSQKAAKTAAELASNTKKIRAIERQRGLKEGELEDFIEDPAMAERITKEPKKTQASQPIDPEQLAAIEKVESLPEFESASPAKKSSMLRKGGVSKENTQAVVEPYIEQEKIGEKKLTREEASFQRSYDKQKEFIDKTTDSYKGFETEMKPRLLQMRNIPDEDLIGPTSAVFLDALGIPLGALENPASELYDKLSQDLLKGLPETYGSRILKVEVDNFLKTIPRLMNSPDGRRMIASNMLKLGEMKEVYYNAMRNAQREALDNRKNLPEDFQQKVFDQVRPQIDRINNEFVKMSEITSVPKNTIPFFSPSGQIQFVPKEHLQWAIENGGRRIW